VVWVWAARVAAAMATNVSEVRYSRRIL